MSRARDLSRLSNSQAFSVDSNFNVGINTDNPQVELDVSGNANISGNISVGGTITYDDVTNIDSIGIITARSDVSIADRIIHTGDTDTTIRFPAADTITAETAGFERVRIDSSGNVGIGTTSPTDHGIYGGTLEISGNPGGALYLTSGSDVGQLGMNSSGLQLRTRTAKDILFTTNNFERMRIDANGHVNIKGGNLFVGLDSATLDFTDSNSYTKFVEIGADGVNGGDALLVTHSSGRGVGYFGYESGGDRLVVACDNGGGNNKIDFIVNATSTSGGSTDNLNGVDPALRIDSSGRLLVGTTSTSADVRILAQGSSSFPTGSSQVYLSFGATTVPDGVGLGYLRFSDSGHVSAAEIIAARDGGTWTSGSSQPSRLVFATTADGASIPTERMRIDSDGRLLVGTSTAIASGNEKRLQIVGYTNAGAEILLGRNDDVVAAGNVLGALRFFGNDSDGTYQEVAGVTCNAGGTHATGDKPGELRFLTTAAGASSPTQRMLIDSSGNVSIDAADGKLNLTKTGLRQYQLQVTGGGANDGLAIRDESGATEIARFTRSGNVGIGTAVPSAPLTCQVNGSSLAIQTALRLESTVDSAVGGNGVGSSIDFYDEHASGNLVESARIASVVTDGAGTSRSADLTFWTSSSANGPTGDSSIAVERMRIDSLGNVAIGKTSANAKFQIYDDTLPYLYLHNSTTGTTTLDGFSIVEIGVDAYINNREAGNMLFYNNGSERMRIDSSGNVGIGTTSVTTNFKSEIRGETYQLRISNAANNKSIRFGTNDPEISATGASFGIRTTDANPLLLFTNNQERMTIDSSGRLLVGTTSTSADTRAIIQGRSSASNSTGRLYVASGNNTPGDGDGIGELYFSSSAHVASVKIAAQRDGGTWTAGSSLPTRLTFATTSDGASSPTERMRLDSAGSLVLASGTAFVAPYIYGTTTASAANVNVTSAGFLLRSTSSIKYKTNVETIEDQYADAILGCRPVWYRSTCENDNPNHGWWGFIAEEVAEIDPRLVHWKTTETVYDDDNNPSEQLVTPEPEGVQYDRFVPHLLNLIKRQQQAIETLEAKVAALEAE